MLSFSVIGLPVGCLPFIDGIVATGRQVSLTAEPVVLASELCSSQDDFVQEREQERGQEGGRTMYRLPFLLTKDGWI